jgi:hypothetical protein
MPFICSLTNEVVDLNDRVRLSLQQFPLMEMLVDWEKALQKESRVRTLNRDFLHYPEDTTGNFFRVETMGNVIDTCKKVYSSWMEGEYLMKTVVNATGIITGYASIDIGAGVRP